MRTGSRRGLAHFPSWRGGRRGGGERRLDVKKLYPRLNVCVICCPPLGFEKDESQNRMVEGCIRAAKPHILFVGLGAPKQEYWMHRYVRPFQIPVAIGVGGSFEIVGGVLTRAPLW